ncbi:AAA family ATPase [Devosia salina]|uniref:AAA family ATPase n=1 Tax=Devosia salina TaxID=2860336 RepID=A0ABX8WJZ5_9HYPH|nr:AAA family ATPase [Devosia salina]QYO78334.1 AAA family ATPase [Devosia salina]
MTSEKRAASGAAKRVHAERVAHHQHIRDGLLPTLDDLIEGSPWFKGSIVADIQTWCDSWMSLPEPVREPGKRIVKNATAKSGVDIGQALAVLRNTCTSAAIEPVRQWMAAAGYDDEWRMRCYQACLDDRGDQDDREAAYALAQHIAEDTYFRTGFHDAWSDATVLGLMLKNKSSMEEYHALGVHSIECDHLLLSDLKLAASEAAKASAQVQEPVEEIKPAAHTDAEFLRELYEDRSEIEKQEGPPLAPGVVVIPETPIPTTGWRKDIWKDWQGKVGVKLPAIATGDIAAHRRSLVAQWPHSEEIIDVILGDLSSRQSIRFRPTLLVGAPGSGKSSLARAIFETVGLPCELQSFAGLHDAALMGTSAQWSSARESAPLQLIKRAGMSSVGIIWDELEKASSSRHNGAPADALLPMLEADQARRYRDLALEVEVDLSMVSHFATANSLEGVPEPVRDRMRVLQMPNPDWEHLYVLTQQIIGRIAAQQGVDRRWYAPLAEDEMDLVRDAWQGGSIRQLTRIVGAILNGREQIMGRC